MTAITEVIPRFDPRSDANESETTAVLAAVEVPNSAGIARAGWESSYIRRLLGVDLAAGAIAGGTALALRFGAEWQAPYNRTYLLITVLFPVVWVAALFVNRAYETRFLFLGNEEYARVIRSAMWLTAVSALTSFALNLQISRIYPLIAMPMAALLGFFGRYAVRHVLHRAWSRGEHLRRVIAVGHEQSVWELTSQLRRERFHGMEVVGVCLPSAPLLATTMLGGRHRQPPVYGALDVEEVTNAIATAQADTVIVLPCPEFGSAAVRRLAWKLEQDEIDLVLASALLDVAGDRTSIRPVVGLPLLHVEHPRLQGGGRLVKEVVDRVLATIGIVLLSPLLAIVAVAIKCSRGGQGPVIFRQVRVGRHGRQFVIFKFRTMYANAEARLAGLRKLNDSDGTLFKMRNDPRITPVGRFLRRYSLDELPQLFNVFLGNMSLVGPRPPLPSEVAKYGFDMRRRLVVKPGLTGLWQVSGRSDLSWEESVRLDVHYVENWSFPMDLLILTRTVRAVFHGSGAY